ETFDGRREVSGLEWDLGRLQNRSAHANAKQPLTLIFSYLLEGLQTRCCLNKKCLSDRGEFRQEGAGTADAVAGHLCFAAIRVEKPDARSVLLVVGRHHHQESVPSDTRMAIQNRCPELGQRA